jgi:hypothetical protein
MEFFMADARNITQKTRERLYSLSSNQCAFPNCNVKLFNEEGTNISNICHIEAAYPDGERYNANSTDDERRNYENLILLCPNHHKETDDINKYTVEVLKKMKRYHEAKFLKPQILRKHISVLNIVINYIGNRIIDNPVNESPNAPNIQDKIFYNNVNEYKSIIEEYALYNSHLNKLYKEIEEQGSPKKEIILQNIRNLYLKEKANKNMDEIRNNADDIIEKIKNKLWENIERNENSFELSIEVIEISLLVILVDAFMRCKILEEPKA